MNGIYLTQEGKQQIKDKISEIESRFSRPINAYRVHGELKVYKEILDNATILPVEDSWDDIQNSVVSRKQLPFSYTEEYYPNGVIIQPKQ